MPHHHPTPGKTRLAGNLSEYDMCDATLKNLKIPSAPGRAPAVAAQR